MGVKPSLERTQMPTGKVKGRSWERPNLGLFLMPSRLQNRANGIEENRVGIWQIKLKPLAKEN